MSDGKGSRMSFRFDDKYKELLDEIAKLDRRSMTDEMKILIDKRAVELGLEPAYPLTKKTQ